MSKSIAAVSQEHAVSFRSFMTEMIQTRVWLVLISRLLLFTGLFCFVPHFQTEVTNFFAERHSEDEVECIGTRSDDDDDPPEPCKEAHNDVLFWTTIRTMFSAFFVSLLLNPAIGTWSDMYGRKLFLIFSFLARVLTSVVVLFYVHLGFPLYWYYPVEVVVQGVNGSSVILAYISDVISEQHRLLAFGISTLTLCFGGIGGTVLTISGAVVNIESAAIVMGAFSVIAALIVLFFIPESLTVELQLAARQTAQTKLSTSWTRSAEFAWKSFLRSVKILIRTPFFRRLTVVLFIVCLCAEEYIEYTTQYLQEVLGFGTHEQALMTLFSSVTGVFLLTIGSWILVSYLKATDKQLLILGTLFVGLGIGIMAVVQKAWMAYMAACFISFWMFLSMAISSFKANNVEATEQGAAQGAVTAINALGFGIGPLLFFVIFKSFRSGGLYIPGAPYYFSFALMMFALYIAVTIRPPTRDTNATNDVQVNEEIDQEAQRLLPAHENKSSSISNEN